MSKVLPAAPQTDSTDHKDKGSKRHQDTQLDPGTGALGAGSPSSCAGCTCPGPQSIPGTSQPCPFWTLSQDPLVSREVGRGREGRAGTHSLTSSSTRLPGQQEEAGEDLAGSRLQHECGPSGSSLSFKYPLVSHRRGQCRPAGRGTRLWHIIRELRSSSSGVHPLNWKISFSSPPPPPRPSPSPNLYSVSNVMLERGFFCLFVESE